MLDSAISVLFVLRSNANAIVEQSNILEIWLPIEFIVLWIIILLAVNFWPLFMSMWWFQLHLVAKIWKIFASLHSVSSIILNSMWTYFGKSWLIMIAECELMIMTAYKSFWAPLMSIRWPRMLLYCKPLNCTILQ